MNNTQTKYELTVKHEYFGLSDYWGGNGKRWDDNAGCLFAFVSHDTTLQECIDQWCDDFTMGGDCDSFPENVDYDQLYKALIDSLTPQGKIDLENDALCEFAKGLEPTPSDEQYCGGYDIESPQWIILVECKPADGFTRPI